jgi:flagellum-specific ATP synthase
MTQQPDFSPKFAKALESLQAIPKEVVGGRLVGVTGLTLEVVGCRLSIGQRCHVETVSGRKILAEVVGFKRDKTFLMPYRAISGLASNAKVTGLNQEFSIPVGDSLLGRTFDGLMQPLDGGPEPGGEMIKLWTETPNPLTRKPVIEPLDVGVKAINSMLTTGKGQRIGLFAGAGLGKSVLLGMITRYTKASIIIVGLIGERGREVREFIEDSLGPEGMKRSVVIAAPADQSPLMRMRAAEVCHRLAEYYRDKGEDVLLLMDSFTRYAQAKRELALAIGEPPATRGYPPSVFAALTQLAERAGNGAGIGTMTAIYTVLAEGDDQQDPIADAARAILDGHVILSRELAESGHYPAIDIPASISRVMTKVTEGDHQKYASRIRKLLSKYDAIKDLIPLGGYVPGQDPETDEAVQRYPAMVDFLKQGTHEKSDLDESIAMMKGVLS